MTLINKFLFICDSNIKKNLFFLIFLVLTSSFLEMIGIGAIVPIISFFFNNETKYFFFEYIDLNFSNFQLVMVFIFFFFFLYLLKSLFLTFTYKFQTSLIYKFQAELTSKIFKNLILSNFNKIMSKKSSEIIRNLTLEMDQLIFSVVQPLLNLASELIFFISIVTILFWYDFITTSLLITIFSILLSFYYFFSKRYLRNIGSERQFNENKKIKTLQESIGGIRDLILLNQRENFIEIFNKSTSEASNSKSKIEFINYLPKIWIEFFLISLVCVVAFFYRQEDQYIKNFLPMLALYAFAGFRLIPIINRLVIGYNHIKYGSVVLNIIYDEMKNIKKNENSKLDIKNCDQNFKISTLEMKDLSFSYDKNDAKNFNGLNLKFYSGDRVGVTGPSGSGKSTFFDLISGFLIPQKGQVILNQDVKNKNLINYKYLLGYVPQQTFFYDDVIYKNIVLDNNNVDQKKIDKIIEICFLKELINERKKDKIGENGKTLSGGQKQRIAIARSLYFSPRVLILDEATNAMNSDLERDIIENIFNLSSLDIIFISSHRKENLNNCNKIFDTLKKNLINDK